MRDLTMMKLEDAIKEVKNDGKKIGCVYPHNDNSYWIDSNLGETELVECSDGFFYAEVGY